MASAAESANLIAVTLEDEKILHGANIQRLQIDLASWCIDLKPFVDSNKCIEFIRRTNEKRILLIVSELNGEEIVRAVLDRLNLHLICVVCSNRRQPPTWTSSVEKSIRILCVDLPLLSRHIQNLLKEKTSEEIAFDVLSSPATSGSTMNGDKSKNKQDGSFWYSVLLSKILREMSYVEEDMTNMIKFFCEKSRTDESRTLARSYTSDKALYYYTKEPLFYENLNRALRTSNLDEIYTMGIFIKDLHRQLVQLYKPLEDDNQTLHVYRGVVMTAKDFERIQKNVGGLMSINQFLSSSTSQNVAKVFAFTPKSDEIGVLFRMKIDAPTSRTICYADVKEYSQFKSEDEYLFTMCSVFRIISTMKVPDQNLWHVDLKLTTDHDEELKTLIDFYQKLIGKPSLISLCFVLNAIGANEKVIEICETMEKHFKESYDRSALYLIWAKAYNGVGNNREASDKFIQFCSDTTLWDSADNNPSVLQLYCKAIALFLKGNITDALRFFKRCVELEQNNPDSEFHRMILAASHQMITAHLLQQGDESGARKHYKLSEMFLEEPILSSQPLVLFNSFLLDSVDFSKEAKDKVETTGSNWKSGIGRLHTDSPVASLLGIVSQHLGESSSSTSGPPGCPSRLPSNAFPFFEQLWKFWFEKNWDGILSTIDDIFRLQDQYGGLSTADLANLYVTRAVSQKKKGQFVEALKSLTQAESSVVENDPEARMYIQRIRLEAAVVHIEQNNDEECLKILKQLKHRFDTETGFSLNKTDRIPLELIFRLFEIRAQNYMICKQYKEARVTYKTLLNILEDFPPDEREKTLEILRNIAYCFYFEKNYTDAYFHFKQVLEISDKQNLSADGKQPHFWKLFGDTCVKLEIYDDEPLRAFEQYARSLQNYDPEKYDEMVTCYHMCAKLLIKANRSMNAIPYFERAIEIRLLCRISTEPKTEAFLIELAEVHQSLRQYDEAIQTYHKALKRYNGSKATKPSELISTYVELGVIYELTKHHSAAQTHLRHALDLCQRYSPDAIESITQIVTALDRVTDELNKSQFSIDEMENQMTTLWSLVHKYHKLHDLPICFSHLETILQVQSNFSSMDHVDIATTLYY